MNVIERLRNDIKNARSYKRIDLQYIFNAIYDSTDYKGCVAHQLEVLRFLYGEVSTSENVTIENVCYSPGIRSILEEKFNDDIWWDYDFVTNLPYDIFNEGLLLNNGTSILDCTEEGLLKSEDFVLDNLDNMHPQWIFYWLIQFCTYGMTEDKLLSLATRAPKSLRWWVEEANGYMDIESLMEDVYEDVDQEFLKELRAATSEELYRVIIHQTIGMIQELQVIPRDREEAVGYLKTLLESEIPERFDSVVADEYTTVIRKLIELCNN